MTLTTTQRTASPSPSAPVTRADLHVHSAASDHGATPWLDEIGVAESYSEPERVYDLARKRGMDLVAFTDHDTIAGAWELVERGFENIIVGQEVTTKLAPTQCALHVLVWRLTPTLDDEIASLGLRRDATALAHWLYERQLPHALAHPLFDLNNRLTVATLEHCLLLFGGFEAINFGHTTRRHRTAFAQLMSEFHSDRLARAIHRHGVSPIWPNRWMTAGSDDHALRNIAGAWTQAPGVLDVDSFFKAVMAGAGAVRGQDATTDSLAHQLIAVAGRFVNQNCLADEEKNRGSMASEARSMLHSLGPMRRVFEESRRVSPDAAGDHRRLDDAIRLAQVESAEQFQRMIQSATAPSDLATKARTALRAQAPMIAAQAPAVIAWTHRQRDNAILEELAPTTKNLSGKLRVLVVVDALEHTSGVSRFIFDALRHAEKTNKDLSVLTCSQRSNGWPARTHLCESAGAITLPGFEEVKLSLPRAAGALEQIAALRPDVIHVSTPGPMGLVGVFAARTLGVPMIATHHTELPAYATRRLKTTWAGSSARMALRELYQRCDTVLARSHDSANRLESLGVSRAKVRVLPAGIDLGAFGPDRRDPNVWRQFSAVDPASVKCLYVGRLGAEKNLSSLVASWRAAHCRLQSCGVKAELIVVGDGPMRSPLERALAGAQTHFLGLQTGAALAALYASSDLFVFPSTTDTLGQVVLEARASGLPAIVTDVGGPQEIVLNQVTGFVLPADDHDRWTQAIVTLVLDSVQRTNMGCAACDHAASCSFERTFEAFWLAHQEAAGRSLNVQDRFCLKKSRKSWPHSAESTPLIGANR